MVPWPRRLAGTWRQYSKNAIPQLAKMTVRIGWSLNLRWPYQAAVMNTFDAVSSRIVSSTRVPSLSSA
jgi:hypothetical protein